MFPFSLPCCLQPNSSNLICQLRPCLATHIMRTIRANTGSGKYEVITVSTSTLARNICGNLNIIVTGIRNPISVICLCGSKYFYNVLTLGLYIFVKWQSMSCIMINTRTSRETCNLNLKLAYFVCYLKLSKELKMALKF